MDWIEIYLYGGLISVITYCLVFSLHLKANGAEKYTKFCTDKGGSARSEFITGVMFCMALSWVSFILIAATFVYLIFYGLFQYLIFRSRINKIKKEVEKEVKEIVQEIIKSRIEK